MRFFTARMVEFGRHTGLKIPRTERSVPVRVRLRAPDTWLEPVCVHIKPGFTILRPGTSAFKMLLSLVIAKIKQCADLFAFSTKVVKRR